MALSDWNLVLASICDACDIEFPEDDDEQVWEDDGHRLFCSQRCRDEWHRLNDEEELRDG